MVEVIKTANHPNSDATSRSRVNWLKQPNLLVVLNISNAENAMAEGLSKKQQDMGHYRQPGLLFFGSARPATTLAQAPNVALDPKKGPSH